MVYCHCSLKRGWERTLGAWQRSETRLRGQARGTGSRAEEASMTGSVVGVVGGGLKHTPVAGGRQDYSIVTILRGYVALQTFKHILLT